MTRPSRQKWLLVLVGILLATNIITLAVFWSAGKKGKPANTAQKPRMAKFIVEEMKFDSTQEAAYWTLRDSVISAQRPVWDSIRAAKKSFFELANQPAVSDSLIQERLNNVLEQQKKLDLITLHHFQQVKTLCRPDQVDKFDTVIKEIVTRMTSFRRSNNRPADSTSKK